MGVRNYDIDLDSGVATFLPEAGEPLDLAAVKEAVDRAGFELLWLELEVEGTLSRARDPDGNERPGLTVASTGQRFLLYPAESEQERAGYARVVEWLDAPESRVVIHGRAHSHTGGPPALTVQEVRMLGDGVR